MIGPQQIVSDTAFVLVSYVILTMLGLPLCLMLRGVRLKVVLAPIVGYAAAAGAVPLLYLAGLSMKTIFFILVAIAAINTVVILFSWLNKRRRLQDGKQERNETQELLAVLACWLAGIFMLILPAWTGGLQFTCFQGNIHDQFTYLDAAISYARQPAALILNAGLDDFLRDPLLVVAQRFLFERGAVACTFASFGQICPSQLYRSHYAFRVVLESSAILSLSFLAVNLLATRGLRQTVFSALASVAATVGFWGQYVMDINAWSQMAALTILSALIALVVLKLAGGSRQMSGLPGATNQGGQEDLPGAGQQAAYFIVVAVLVFGSVYCYPEELLLILGSLLASATLTRLLGYRLNTAALVIAALVAGLATCAFCWHGTVGYAIGEMRGRGAVDWWRHFDKFYFGQCWPYSYPQKITLSSLVDGSAGLFGVYFLTPFSDFSRTLKILVRALLALWLFGLVACAVKAFVDRIDQKLIMFTLIAFSILGVAAVLCLAGHFWTAGKLVSYLAPYLMLSICLPLFSEKRFPYAVPAVLLVVIQIMFGAYRPLAAANPTGIHYDGAFYPSIQDPSWKTSIDWRIDKLSDSLSGCSSIKIDVAEPLVRHWVMYFLASRGLTYYSTGEVHKFLSLREVLGQATVAPGRHCVLSLEPDVNRPMDGATSIRRFVLRHSH